MAPILRSGPEAGKQDGNGATKNDTAGMSAFAKAWVDVGPYLGISWVFAFSIAATAALGYWIDSKLGTGRKFFIAGCIVGIAVGFYNFFKVVLAAGKRKTTR